MALPLHSGKWTIDSAHSVVQFSVKHLGISLIRGRFGDVEATLAVGDDLGSSALSATIGMGSIHTGNSDRDGHVQSSDFFNAEVNPKMTFASNAIEQSDDGSYTVNGELSLNGHSGQETLKVTLIGTEDNPLDGSHRAGFAAMGKIDRTDYGIDWNVPLASGGSMLGTTVEITIDAQLVAPSAN